MEADIVVSCPVEETTRVMQIRGMFDLPAEKESAQAWHVVLPLEEKQWNIGLIVGPSGCGKSTVARKIWPAAYGTSQALAWPESKSVLDALPEFLSIKESAALLSSVGFSSPPAWLRPFHALSTGQQFRVTLARLLSETLALKTSRNSPAPSAESSTSENLPLIVFDEYTSVVDRTVAQVASAALAKVVRAHALAFVAVTCHEDVEEWLNPDWVYRPAERAFAWRSLRPLPSIILTLFRCQASAWPFFAPHHYLSENLSRSAWCWLATWQGRPCCFSAWLPWVGSGPPGRREHRTVCHPDYQGVGIGNKVSATIASMWKALGYRATSTTTHPAMIESRKRSPLWRLLRAPSFAVAPAGFGHAATRLTAGFEYVGPAMNRTFALSLMGE